MLWKKTAVSINAKINYTRCVRVILHYVSSSLSPYLQFKENLLFLPRSIVTKKLTKPDRTLNIIVFSFRIMPSCSICTKDLRDRKALIRHGEKQFICDICSKSFYRKDELIEHMYTHNVAMDQNVHVCPTCGHSFKTAGKMRDRTRATHSQSLSCQMCSKTFQTKGNLSQHMKLHAGLLYKM